MSVIAGALALGVTPDQIQNALYTAYGNRHVSNIYAPANQYAVILEVKLVPFQLLLHLFRLLLVKLLLGLLNQGEDIPVPSVDFNLVPTKDYFLHPVIDPNAEFQIGRAHV